MNKPASAPKSERRRFLRISAGCAAAAAFPVLAASSGIRLHVKRDVLLGAETEIQLYHANDRAARLAMEACIAKVRRLESIFSLQQADSALSRLNADGFLDNPPMELVKLLLIAEDFSRVTDGAFDVTVQPLWRLYAGHFAREDADPAGPSPAEIAEAVAKVDYRHISIGGNRVAFTRPGMSATLNGIAQGFITDRVADTLRAAGLRHVLVNMGEMRALAGHPGGAPWRIGIADPEKPWRHMHTVDLVERAVATSGGYGTTFDRTGRCHHLFDPRTGLSSQYYRSISVTAPSATTADALSTGLSILPPDAAQRVVARYGAINASLMDFKGRTLTFTSA